MMKKYLFVALLILALTLCGCESKNIGNCADIIHRDIHLDMTIEEIESEIEGKECSESKESYGKMIYTFSDVTLGDYSGSCVYWIENGKVTFFRFDFDDYKEFAAFVNQFFENYGKAAKKLDVVNAGMWKGSLDGKKAQFYIDIDDKEIEITIK